METPQLSHSAFTSITSSLGLVLQPHQTGLRRGLFTGKGSRWAPLGPKSDTLVSVFSGTCELKILPKMEVVIEI